MAGRPARYSTRHRIANAMQDCFPAAALGATSYAGNFHYAPMRKKRAYHIGKPFLIHTPKSQLLAAQLIREAP